MAIKPRRMIWVRYAAHMEGMTNAHINSEKRHNRNRPIWETGIGKRMMLK
jgi:hypothetical protein